MRARSNPMLARPHIDRLNVFNRLNRGRTDLFPSLNRRDRNLSK
jgi:hypothetical protein